MVEGVEIPDTQAREKAATEPANPSGSRKPLPDLTTVPGAAVKPGFTGIPNQPSGR